VDGFVQSPPNATLIDVAARALQPSARLLDIGCGAGQVVIALAEQFDNLIGIDFADRRIESGLQALRAHYPQYLNKVQLRVNDSEERLPFEDDSFDVVVALAVLEHVVDPFHFMDEIARVCKPGGRIIVQVPNIAYIRHVFDLLRGEIPLTGTLTRDISRWRNDGWDSGHLHYFTRKSLGALLRHTGFAPEAWTGSGRFARFRRWWSLLVGDLTVRARRVKS